MFNRRKVCRNVITGTQNCFSKSSKLANELRLCSHMTCSTVTSVHSYTDKNQDKKRGMYSRAWKSSRPEKKAQSISPHTPSIGSSELLRKVRAGRSTSCMSSGNGKPILTKLQFESNDDQDVEIKPCRRLHITVMLNSTG